jgi:Domain of unknown function (DUF4263)
MDRQTIKSTSLSSATCSDVVLRENETTRLVFRPQLVDNPHDNAAAVNGVFLFQRKGKKDEWANTATIPLSSLKKNEGMKLELHAAEVLHLFKTLSDLYRLHARDGIPLGQTELVRADSILAKLSAIPRSELRVYLSAQHAIGANLLSDLLAWATEVDVPELLVPRLISLGESKLRTLNAAVGLSRLKRAIATWEEQANMDDEEFWQQSLAGNSFVLEQVFAWPATIVKGKAYVGGKSVLNTGGNVVDFLVKNYFTNNAALVEIKTPATKLLGKRYRAGIYNPSEDLSGAVMQVLNYRHTFQRDYYSLTHGVKGGLEAFEPRCVVIIGSNQQMENDDMTKTLELFRNQWLSVAVITFDELFAKTRRLIEVLEGATNEGSGEANATA